MEPEVKKRKRSWLKILFGLSLAMNLLIVGMAAGMFLRGPHGGHHGFKHGGPRSGGLHSYFMAMDESDRKALRRSMREEKKDFRQIRKKMAENKTNVLAAIRQVPFDRAKVEAAFEQQRQLMSGGSRFAHSTLLDYIESLTDEGRAQYADKVQSYRKSRSK